MGRITGISREKSVTPAQLALARVLARADNPVAISGTKRRRYLEENIAALEMHLSPEELQRIDQSFPINAAVGARY